MSEIVIEHQKNMAILRLKNGVTNAISPGLVNTLSESVRDIRKECQGLVLAGGSKFFSIGLNLPELLKLDPKGMNDFWYQFDQLVFDLFTLPVPTVCAIGGHAIAGGNILALTCDYRFAASGKKLIGLNEVRLGLPVPYLPDMILRQLIGDRLASRMLYYGEFISLSDAKQIGLADEIFPDEAVENQAVEKVAELAALPGPAFAAIKANRVEAIRARYEKNYRTQNDIFLDCWFSDPVQALLREASQKF